VKEVAAHLLIAMNVNDKNSPFKPKKELAQINVQALSLIK